MMPTSQLKPPPPLIFPKNGGKSDTAVKPTFKKPLSWTISDILFEPFIKDATQAEELDLTLYSEYVKRRNASLPYKAQGFFLDTLAPNIRRYKYHYLGGILALIVAKKVL